MWKTMKWMFFLIIIFLVTIITVYVLTPEPKEYIKQNPKKSAFMKMRINEAKAKGKSLKIFHRYMQYSKISEGLKDAVRISEDGGFFGHKGFDFAEIKESIITNWKRKKFKRGGSTITQQLAKNLYLSSEKSLVRKFQEAILTIKLEHQLPKKRIFDLYLNYIEFGHGVFGVEAASKKYFRKSASELTVFEAARLASIIPNPRKRNPNRPTKWLKYRTKILLTRLYKFKKISKNEYQKALSDFDRFFTS